MKKVLKFILPMALIAALLAFSACQPSAAEQEAGLGDNDTAFPVDANVNEPGEERPDATAPETEGDVPVILVTDYGTIDDGSFNQGSWEGVAQFAARRGIAHTFLQPIEVSTAAYLDSIEQAIGMGAQIVVTPGFLFAEAVYEAQDLFPETYFVLIDAVPVMGYEGAVPRVGDNVVSVLYAEEESGFLAGYAAVMEGHRNLGFMGGIAVPAVVRFGHGFVEGAEYAAQALGLGAGEVTIHYTYLGSFSPHAEFQAQAAAWFNEGTEIIFAAAGGAGFSVMAAAEANNGLVIGVDIDQAGDSETVVTSALKGLTASVYSVLDDFFAGNFPGGEEKIFDASVDGVSLPMETSRFEVFTQEQYDEIFARLAAGEIEVSDDFSIGVTELDVNLVTVVSIS